MFTKSFQYYDSLYAFKDYAEASRQLRRLVDQERPRTRTLLDVGCGTGRHLENLRDHYAVEGLDLNPDLLAVARARNPEVPLHEGDMTQFALGRRFDVVTCLFSSIGYVKSVENMRRAVAQMAGHLEPGGILVMEPWLTPEQYWVGRITANYVNEPELKIAWMYLSQRQGNVSHFDIHYMVGTPEGVHEFTELHEMGLFTRDEYEHAFRAAGLSVTYDPTGFFNRGLYLGRAGSASA
jgi:SAM-dependent methyltransferase